MPFLGNPIFRGYMVVGIPSLATLLQSRCEIALARRDDRTDARCVPKRTNQISLLCIQRDTKCANLQFHLQQKFCVHSPLLKIRRPGSACTGFFSYVASKILSQGAHPKSPVQNPKSKIPKIQNPKSPKSKIPKFQNPNFAHKDLLHNVPKIQNPKSPKSRKSKIQNPQNPKSKIPKIQNPQNPQNPKSPKSQKSKIQNPQNPKSPKSKIQAFLAGFWGFWILGILDFGFGIPAPKSKIQTPQNPKSPKSKIQNPQNPKSPKSKILRRNAKFGALGASRKELLPNDAKS